MSTSSDFLVVAHVLTAHGVRGEVKCRLVTDFPGRRFKRGTRLYLGPDHRPVTVSRARIQGNTALVQFQEITDRAEAQTLRNAELTIPVEEAGRPPKGEFFWHEVIGLLVVDSTTDQELGTVADILETGANDVYVVRGPRGEILVPAIKDVVKLIDPSAGRMLIEPLPGMMRE